MMKVRDGMTKDCWAGTHHRTLCEVLMVGMKTVAGPVCLFFWAYGSNHVPSSSSSSSQHLAQAEEGKYLKNKQVQNWLVKNKMFLSLCGMVESLMSNSFMN